MKLRPLQTLVAFLLVLLVCGSSNADFVVASRHALVKTAPASEAEKIRSIDRDEALPLTDPAQVDGYYHVRLGPDSDGWVYRTFVRRFTELPASAELLVSEPGAVPSAAFSSNRNVIFGMPSGHNELQILENTGYTVGYSPDTRTPLWACYRIFAVGDAAGPTREDKFAADDRVPEPVGPNDYGSSGYDRGHMAPSAPVGKRYGKAAQDKTFLMSNMVPQVPGLNQRGWEALEDIISSDYAERFEEVWVFVGPIFDGPCRELLTDVRIPSECFMIIVDVREADNAVRALAVVMPQRRINNEPLSDFVVTVDDIEARTGIDFLSGLPDSIETALEASRPDSDWHINQILQPRFTGTSRPLNQRLCN